MESNPNEKKAVSDTAREGDVNLELTLRENVGEADALPDGFAKTVFDFPVIDEGMTDPAEPKIPEGDIYRVERQLPITGNRPIVPDAIPPTKTVTAVKTNQEFVNETLKGFENIEVEGGSGALKTAEAEKLSAAFAVPAKSAAKSSKYIPNPEKKSVWQFWK